MYALLSRPLSAARCLSSPSFLAFTTTRNFIAAAAGHAAAPPPRTFTQKPELRRRTNKPAPRDPSAPSKYLAHGTSDSPSSGAIDRPYTVNRTPWGQLAVYKTGRGTKVYTKIRKVEGNKKEFIQQLTAGLKLETGEVSMNPVTGNIHVKVR